MKARNLVVYAIAAASLGVSSLSFAQGHGQRGHREEPPRVQRHDDRRDHAQRGPQRGPQFDRRDRRDVRIVHRHYNARGPAFKRGGYIPHEYRGRQHVVVNHYQHRLSAPPRGHQWVQVGGDYVLIAIATGLIANLIFNN